MRVRAATAADYSDIAGLLRVCPEASQWHPEGYEIAVADGASGLAGFIAWRATAPDEIEILNLAVHPAQRRRGIAKALLAALPPRSVFLEVRESNFAARALYRSAGFIDAGTRPGYYRDPVEEAIVMRLQS